MTVISIIGQTMHGPLNWEYSHNNEVRCFGAFFDLPTTLAGTPSEKLRVEISRIIKLP